MEVLYTSNDLFIGKVGISICSLFENNKQEEEINVHIFGQNISEKNQDKLNSLAQKYGRKITLYSIGDMAAELNIAIASNAWHSIVLARFLVARYLPESIKRVLYLDGDTIVVDSLGELWNTDLKGYVLGGCIAATYHNNKQKQSLVGDAPYINAGILLINLELWRQRNVEERLLCYYNQNFEKLTALDQDSINGELMNEIYYLPPKYNFYNVYWFYKYHHLKEWMGNAFYYSQPVYQDSVEHPAIIHFLGEERPWRRGNHHKFKSEFLGYKEVSPWRDEPEETGWERYFSAWDTFNLLIQPFPQARYAIICKLIPFFTKYRTRKLKKQQNR